MLAGAGLGILIFMLDALSLLFDYALHDYVSERAGSKDLRAMLLYLLLFIGAGALCGWLQDLRVRILRYVLPGAIAGALVWSYFTATWALRASAFTMGGPASSVMDAAATGAALGALGGLLLFAIGWLRRK